MVINGVTYSCYTFSIDLTAAPENIIFNNGNGGEGNQTENLVFKADSIYTYGVPEPEPIVETAYYLIGAFNEWSQDTKVAFTKGDDGNFTLTYTFSGQFKILDQDGNWLGAGTENNYYQLTEDNSDVELVDGNNLYLESEAEYTLTIDGSIMTVTGFPAEPDPVYTVVGTYVVDGVETDSIFGQSWAILEANDMEADQNSDGCYTKTFNVKLLPAGTILYKVVKNHSWTINWGFPTGNDGNADYVVKTDDPDKPAMENVTITFTFNPDVAINGEECHLLCTVTGTPTGISNVAGQRTEQFIYSVQGVKLQKVQKGLNIINGRKVVVK